MANTAATVLKELVGGSNAGGLISSISISGETKHAFAREDPSIDTKELISNRQYKKKHRRKLSAFYNKKCAQDPAYNAKIANLTM